MTFDSFGDHILCHWKGFLRQVDSDGGFGSPVRRNGILEDLRLFFFLVGIDVVLREFLVNH